MPVIPTSRFNSVVCVFRRLTSSSIDLLYVDKSEAPLSPTLYTERETIPTSRPYLRRSKLYLNMEKNDVCGWMYAPPPASSSATTSHGEPHESEAVSTSPYRPLEIDGWLHQIRSLHLPNWKRHLRIGCASVESKKKWKKKKMRKRSGGGGWVLEGWSMC
ncbi:hypothetical protein BGW80DRAFT_1255492 [Lactifluus volemus]|nr:hypothetical protein BGW80DRAFT_1255492 [Lactifluus volemus]